MNVSAITVPAVDNGIAAYMREIKKFPILDAEEEYMLAQRWQAYGDTDAAHRMVTSHLRLVAKIAMGYRNYGLAIADLISEGNMGLMRAVKKFEPERGVRLATYAMWWIKAAITEFILASWSLVKTGTVAAQKKLFFRLRRIKAQMGIYGEGDMSPEQVRHVANELSVNDKDVVDMNQRLSARDASLNALVAEDSLVERQDLLVDEAPNQEARYAEVEETNLKRRLLRKAMEILNDRERHIVTARTLTSTPVTLEDLGRHYGVSRERVRQIEASAMAKLTQAVRSMWQSLEYVGTGEATCL
ncbi:MAG: RNA polymerase sigma factor RpoH [Alphaproteobacteria bacterium]|nr:RNA polymerase sigma factor RpoH [Alphaproteobacteria bacterium]